VAVIDNGVVRDRLGPNSAFANRVRSAAARQVRPMLQAVADDAAMRANAYVEANYQRRTDDVRRRDPSAPHLHGSFTGTVEGTEFPITIALRSSAPDVVVHSLNSGARAHTIRARNAPHLRFPAEGVGASAGYFQANLRKGVRRVRGTRQGGQRVPRPQRFSASPAASAQASSGKPLIKTLEVNHPGIAPSYFMELAVEGAVRTALRASVRLARR